jgi:hypothetical protein
MSVMVLDGKTLKVSFDHLNDRKTVQALSAFTSEAVIPCWRAAKSTSGATESPPPSEGRRDGPGRRAVHRRRRARSGEMKNAESALLFGQNDRALGPDGTWLSAFPVPRLRAGASMSGPSQY